MKAVFTLLLSLSFVTSLAAEAEVNYAKNAKAEAEKVADALIAGKWDIVAAGSLPKVVEMMGGKEKMTTFLEGMMGQMKGQGITFKKVVIGDPKKELVDEGTHYYYVPQTITMGTPNGDVIQESTLLGLSKDGVAWAFIDTAQLDEAKLKMLLPEVAEKIKLPKTKAPVQETAE